MEREESSGRGGGRGTGETIYPKFASSRLATGYTLICPLGNLSTPNAQPLLLVSSWSSAAFPATPSTSIPTNLLLLFSHLFSRSAKPRSLTGILNTGDSSVFLQALSLSLSNSLSLLISLITRISLLLSHLASFPSPTNFRRVFLSFFEPPSLSVNLEHLLPQRGSIVSVETLARFPSRQCVNVPVAYSAVQCSPVYVLPLKEGRTRRAPP